MREILFRGKCTDTGEWLYNMEISKQHYDDEEIFSYYIGRGTKTIVGKTLGQFTGMTDKNGKKIFEHDIVRFGGGVFVVVYYDCRIGFAFSGLFGRGCVPGFGMTNWEHMEIIGNIHDNPELLEKE